jgi:hypothetical protein
VMADTATEAAARKRQRDALLKEEEDRKVRYERNQMEKEIQMRKDLASFKLRLEKDLIEEHNLNMEEDFEEMLTSRAIVSDENWMDHRPNDRIMKRFDPLVFLPVISGHLDDPSPKETKSKKKRSPKPIDYEVIEIVEENIGKKEEGGESALEEYEEVIEEIIEEVTDEEERSEEEEEEDEEEDEEEEEKEEEKGGEERKEGEGHRKQSHNFVHPFDSEETVVIHFGAWSIFAGRNKESVPSLSSLNWMGVTMDNPLNFDETLNYYRTQNRSKSGEVWRSFRRRNCASESEVITNWEQFELVVESVTKAFSSCDERHVILTHSLFEPEESRKRISEIFFEKYQIRSYFSVPATTAAFASANHLDSSCLLIDCGAFETRIVPIYSGFPLMGLSRRLCGLGGIGVREYFHSLVTPPHCDSFLSFTQLDHLFREKCYVSEGMCGIRLRIEVHCEMKDD